MKKKKQISSSSREVGERRRRKITEIVLMTSFFFSCTGVVESSPSFFSIQLLRSQDASVCVLGRSFLLLLVNHLTRTCQTVHWQPIGVSETTVYHWEKHRKIFSSNSHTCTNSSNTIEWAFPHRYWTFFSTFLPTLDSLTSQQHHRIAENAW